MKAAIIGSGMIAQAAHIPAWKALADKVQIVAVMDILEERAQKVAEIHGIPRAYGDWQKMLDQVRPDIVSVCTPNVYHKEPALAALQAGAHVVCEKPIATRYADAVEMYDAARAAGRELFVAQTVRFINAHMAARELAASGKLGEMYYAETAALRRRGIPMWGVFHIKEHNAGGPIYDLGVHMLDLLMWIMGNPRIIAVSGMTYTKFGNRDEGLLTSLADSGAPAGVVTPRPYDYHEFDVEDFASGYMRLENEATVVLRASWAANVPEDAGKTFILGTAGGLQLRPQLQYIANMGRYQADVTLKVPPDRNVPFAGHHELAAHILRVLEGQEEAIVRRAEVLNVMRALEGLYRSAEERREIRLDWL